MIKCFVSSNKCIFHTKSSKHQRQRRKFNPFSKISATGGHIQFQERSQFRSQGHSSRCTENRTETHTHSRLLECAWYEFTYHHRHLYLCEKIYDLDHNHDHVHYCLKCTSCCTHSLLMKLYHQSDDC